MTTCLLWFIFYFDFSYIFHMRGIEVIFVFAVIIYYEVSVTFSFKLTDCRLVFQIVIHAGLLKKGLCSVQDESAGQPVIFSHRRDSYKAVISKVYFLLFCILLGTLPLASSLLDDPPGIILHHFMHSCSCIGFLCKILL